MAAFADFSLDAAFFLKKTRARAEGIGRIAKELKVPKGRGSHVLTFGFTSNGSSPPLILQIDESKYEREPVNYYVQMHLHEGEHADRFVSSRGAAWAFDQLSALAKGVKALFFLEAQMEMAENIPLPSAVIAPPLTVGGRTLSVVGVEYGAPLEGDRVDGFRWTRRENVIRLNVSYTKILAVSLLPSLWGQAKTVVEAYVREVFPR